MSKLQTALNNYTDVQRSLDKFIDHHKKVFDEFTTLQRLVQDTEQQLKSVAAAEGEIENDIVQVKVARHYRKWYDVETLTKLSKPKEWTIITNEAAVINIDRSKFELLVKEQKIRAELMQKSFREEALTPRITITKKNYEEN